MISASPSGLAPPRTPEGLSGATRVALNYSATPGGNTLRGTLSEVGIKALL